MGFTTEKLLNSMRRGQRQVWDATLVAEVFKGSNIDLSKRTVQRFLEGVEWLKTSADSEQQFDGLGRPGVKSVFTSLLSDARRKRRKVYFGRLYGITRESAGPIEDKNKTYIDRMKKYH